MNKFRNEILGFDIFLEKVKMRFFGEIIEIDRFKVTDTFTFWQIECEYETEERALEYIGQLISCKTKQECYFYRWCAKHNVREGSTIQFDDGNQGVILGKKFAEGCLKYSPIKKDGDISKAKRNLYGDLKYKVIKY